MTTHPKTQVGLGIIGCGKISQAYFDGPFSLYQMSDANTGWQEQKLSHIYEDNMRSIGAADMACSILTGRPYRASGHLAYHVLEIMHAFEASSASCQFIEIESRPERPAALPVGLKEGQT